MPYRNIYIANQSKLNLRLNQLVVNNGDELTFPIEDIRSIVVETRQCSLTSALISKLADAGVCLIFCNDKHLPSAALAPINSFSLQRDRVELQLNQSAPFKKRLWQSIATQKILNQAKCLEFMGIEDYKILEAMAKNVKSGDSTNREAYAANIYFKALFGKSFKRDNEDTINACLNFGYSVLRSFIARTLAVYGLEAVFGIHHDNKYNSFNLADDIIEPFRPVIDLFVASNFDNSQEFSTFQRAEITRLMNAVILSGEEKHSVAFAVERLIQSLVLSFDKKTDELKLPQLLKTDYFDYD